MKQVLQNISTGETTLADVPCPGLRPGHLLVASNRTLVSSGTEQMLVDFGKAGWIAKARQQPDKVRMVLDKVKTDGLLPTLDAVRSKLDQPMPMGYCNVGRILESGVDGFMPGDLVVSNGHHAEVVRVPKNLAAKVPEGVSADAAAFTVLGAIGLQGIRLLKPTLGDCHVVVGLGLIGQLCVQILRANGCRVLGIDLESSKCEVARGFGAETVDLGAGEDPIRRAHQFSRGRGVDGVLITASTKSNEPVHQAATMCRKRGTIVLVGVVGLELSRSDFFKKELTFQVSASYGPGRYDPEYEEKGHDYPVGFVRWTEQRNFEAVLDLMASGAIDVEPLISHRFPIERATRAYTHLGKQGTLGLLIEYPQHTRKALETLRQRRIGLRSERATGAACEAKVAFLGAGNYASRVLIPAFKKHGADLRTVVSSSGLSSVHHGRKAGFAGAATDEGEVWLDDSVNAVVIATRHDLHAAQVVRALRSNKHVFVEKPLALTHGQLDAVDAAYADAGDRLLMVGFNRRFAPHIVRMKALLDQQRAPKSFIMTVNAGAIPAGHWTQDAAIGGGRIIGEACHFIDLLRHLAGAPITAHHACALGGTGITDDKAAITLSFADGSMGTIHYLANGSKAFPKERLEVFCDGSVMQLDNFRRLTGYGWPGFSKMNLMKQDKGQSGAVKAFLGAVIEGHPTPIPVAEVLEVSRVTLDIAADLATGTRR